MTPGTPEDPESAWVAVCLYESIYPDTGVCALIEGQQVAVYRLSDGNLHAISNYDPFSRANVLSRGIVGDRGGEPKVASPIYKQTFNLRTGVCYEDASVRLAVFRVRRRNGRVEVFARPVDLEEPAVDDETLNGAGLSRR